MFCVSLMMAKVSIKNIINNPYLLGILQTILLRYNYISEIR